MSRQTADEREAAITRHFAERPRELELYRVLEERLLSRMPELDIEAKKTQISFFSHRMLGCASVPVRRKRDWPEHCLLVTIGLPAQLSSPRVAVATEAAPGRWTHHVLVDSADDIDDELLEWL